MLHMICVSTGDLHARCAGDALQCGADVYHCTLYTMLAEANIK